MNSLLMQLALAALGQFGGNGSMPMGAVPMAAVPMGGASHRSFSCGKETSRHARDPLPHCNSARSHLISPARITGHSHMLDARTTAKPRVGC